MENLGVWPCLTSRASPLNLTKWAAFVGECWQKWRM
jgi:hypothetical protein